jgi:phage regulator Rha-like protein
MVNTIDKCHHNTRGSFELHVIAYHICKWPSMNKMKESLPISYIHVKYKMFHATKNRMQFVLINYNNFQLHMLFVIEN